MKSFGQALYDTGFISGSYYPQTGGTAAGLPAALPVGFQPQALAFTHRYVPPAPAPPIRPADVKGYPNGIPHGGKFSSRTFINGVFQDPELLALVGNEAFLAANPQFRDVVLDFDQNYLDMCMLDGCWTWLVGQEAKYNPAAAGATGPTRLPSGGANPNLQPPPHAAAPATPPAETQTGPIPGVATAPDQTTLQRLLLILEELYPGQAAKYGALANLLVAGGKPSTLAIIMAVAPLFE